MVEDGRFAGMKPAEGYGSEVDGQDVGSDLLGSD